MTQVLTDTGLIIGHHTSTVTKLNMILSTEGLGHPQLTLTAYKEMLLAQTNSLYGQHFPKTNTTLLSDSSDSSDEEEQSTLIHAAATGDVKSLVNLLSSPYAIADAHDSTGYGAIHRASAGGHAVVVQRLLESPATVNLRAIDQSTPLHHACTIGSDAVVRVLGEAVHLEVDAANEKGATPLMACAVHGHASCVDALLRHRADAGAADSAGATALMRASSHGHQRVAELRQPTAPGNDHARSF